MKNNSNKDWVIPFGNAIEVKKGNKVKKVARRGLHLNRLIRDVLRACGYPCYNCDEVDCNDPDFIVNPLILKIEELEARIKALEA